MNLCLTRELTKQRQPSYSFACRSKDSVRQGWSNRWHSALADAARDPI